MLKKPTDLAPNLLDRAVAYFAPKAAVRRLAARHAMARAQAFEGATKGRRTKSWNPGNDHVNSAIIGSLSTLRARSRDLVRNNPWAFGAVDTIVSETIGQGIIPQARDASAPELAKRADALWVEWGDTTACDADGLNDFYGIEALAMKTIAEAGSVLIRRRARRMEDGLPLPIQLQVLEPEYLDSTRDTYASTQSGNLIVNGIEFDRLGRRRGYWLFRDHPANRTVSVALESVFVPASEIIHVYRVDRAGQVDGVPWGAPVVIRLRDLDEFEDAELVKQKIASCFAGFIHDTEPLEDQRAMTDTEKDNLSRIWPGTLEVLPPGKEITFGNPPVSNAYGSHVPWQLRAVSRAFGVTYEACTGDYSQVNFSSGRMGRLQMNRNVARWQQHIMIPRLCKGVWSWFVDAAIVAGRLPRPVGAVWSVPAVQMIDPTKETAALREQVRSGFTTLSEVLRQSGRDPEDVLEERKRDDERLDALGLKLDCDPRRDAGAAAASAEEDEEDDKAAS